MPDLPEYMLQRERQRDQIFAPTERLFRRVPDWIWEDWEDDADIELDAIEFPDMSVTREKYGPPHAARWDRGELVDWGVIGFKVEDIPLEIPFQGAFVYRMRPSHEPQRKNYPHSEVQVFEVPWEDRQNETHVGTREIQGAPLEAQQKWREMIRRKSKIVLMPRMENERK